MASLLPNVKQRFFDENGGPLSGGKLFSYMAGTSTPLATYIDQSEATPNTNPIILDANGEANVWIGGGAYKLVLKDSSDVVQWTVDQVIKIENGSITTAFLADGSVTTIKIADANVTTDKILDNAVTTPKIPNGAITAPKIPDGELAIAKLASTTRLGFIDLLDGQYGGGIRALPIVPWSAPTLIADPTVPPGGDGLDVAWSPTGGLLAVAENAGSFASIYARTRNTIKKVAGLDVAPAVAATAVAWAPDGQTLITGIAGSPYMEVYQRAGLTMKLLGGPDTIPTGACKDAGFSPSGEMLAIAHTTTPFMSVYQKSELDPSNIVARYTHGTGTPNIAANTATRLNFEAKSFDNATSVGVGTGWTFTAKRSDGYAVQAMAQISIGSGDNTFLRLMLYKNGSEYCVLDQKPVGISIIGGSDWLYLSAGDTVAIFVIHDAGASAQFIPDPVYSHVVIKGDTAHLPLLAFNKYTNPATLPAGDAKAVAWSPDNQLLAIGHNVSPFISIYQRTGSTLLDTVFVKITNPSTLPANQVNGLSWSPDGQFLAMAIGASPHIQVYQVSGLTFTMLPAPTALPAGSANAIRWNQTGELLAIAHDTTPFVTVYSFDGTTFTKLADPSLLPAGNASGVSWTPNGEFLSISHANSPFLSTYQTADVIGDDAVLYVKELNLG